jgi:hypothetical protein
MTLDIGDCGAPSPPHLCATWPTHLSPDFPNTFLAAIFIGSQVGNNLVIVMMLFGEWIVSSLGFAGVMLVAFVIAIGLGVKVFRNRGEDTSSKRHRPAA